MVTDDEMYDTLRALLNTGFNSPKRIAIKVGLPQDLVEEALELAHDRGLVVATPGLKDFRLNSTGELELRTASLQRLVDFESQAFRHESW